MCLFTKGRNALIAVLDLALHEEHGPVALPAICQRTGLSLSYLECIFRKLRQHGIVLTIRGVHGGFMLARPTNTLTVADIILAIDESIDESIDETIDESGDASVKASEPGATCTGEAVTAQELWTTLNQQLIAYCRTISVHELIERQRARSRSTIVECPRSPLN